MPRSVKIELTARCDFQCFFCASHMRLRAKDEIEPRVFRRIVREMRELGVEELGLFYLGESFTCRWLADAVRFAKRECGYPYGACSGGVCAIGACANGFADCNKVEADGCEANLDTSPTNCGARSPAAASPRRR